LKEQYCRLMFLFIKQNIYAYFLVCAYIYVYCAKYRRLAYISHCTNITLYKIIDQILFRLVRIRYKCTLMFAKYQLSVFSTLTDARQEAK